MFGQNPGTGFTIWLTGMQGAGKRTLAREVVNRLKRLDKPVEYLDGPEWEVFVGRGPGGTKEERNALVRRAGFLARAITRAGGFPVVSHISPYRELREQLRREIGRFLEVFVDCPVETLLARDTRGEYQKAMRGEIKNFIGITDPYEPPGAPEVRYDSSKQSVDEGASMVLEALVREGVLAPADAGLARAPRKPEQRRAGRKPASILFTPEMLVLPKVAPKPLAKKPEAEVEAKKPAAKVEAKKPVAKVEAKKPAAKVEAKKPAAKVEAKKPAPKVQAKQAKKSTAVKTAPNKVAARTARATKHAKKK